MQQENMPNETVEVTVDETNKAIQTSEQEPNVEVSESPKLNDELLHYAMKQQNNVHDIKGNKGG